MLFTQLALAQNVGIGTPSPQAKFDVENTTTNRSVNVHQTLTDGAVPLEPTYSYQYVTNKTEVEVADFSPPSAGNANAIVGQENRVIISENSNLQYGSIATVNKAFGSGNYTAGTQSNAVYYGPSTFASPATPFPQAIGVIGEVTNNGNTSEFYNATGVLGLNEEIQDGSNFGVVGYARNGNFRTVGVNSIANADQTQVQAFDLTLPGAFSAAILGLNSESSATDYGLYVKSNQSAVIGNLGVSPSDAFTPSSQIDVEGATGYQQLRLRTPYTPTSSADANGEVGDISWDDNYIYVKTPSGWRRATLSAF